MISGVIAVVIFWIGWVSLNPADEKAMATFISVEDLINDNINKHIRSQGHPYETLRGPNTVEFVPLGHPVRSHAPLFPNAVKFVPLGHPIRSQDPLKPK